jgi:hypothetical protein
VNRLRVEAERLPAHRFQVVVSQIVQRDPSRITVPDIAIGSMIDLSRAQ